MARIAEPAHTRRVFLGTGAAVVAAAVLPGCGSAPVSESRRIAAFVELSRALTGVRDLPRVHAGRYLEALNAAGLDMGPSKLAEQAGYLDGSGPRELDDLLRSPALSKPGAEACARAITGAWWSGTVTDAAKQTTLVTYDDALVFRAMPYAQPQAQCLGATGAWSQLGRAAA